MSLGEVKNKSGYKWFHRSRQIFDEIRVTTNPRYKESELSGDEWRISATAEFLYKGKVIWSQTFRNCETAAQLMYGYFTMKAAALELEPESRKDLCDQEGCSDKATVRCYLKKEYCNDGHGTPCENKKYVQFCEKHSFRGDCGLEDSEDNYIKENIVSH